MHNIIDSIRKFYPVSEDSLMALTSKYVKKEVAANELVIRGGHMNRYVYFIEKGLCRSYCNVDGEEVTSWFSREGDITFALLSLYRNEPGFEFVETVEPTTFYLIEIEELNKLYTTHIDIANWSRVVHQECVLGLQTRRIERLRKGAKERYELLMREQPDLFTRVKMSHLASFLGMTPQHLSKVRGDRNQEDISPIY
ncbi:Crp/Fnr family transcriptional regulator [Halosquirtibacter laminarini]|uniref:Crp/Fnr family transcriptional regulator n=1 Tax=Halosquirtibacter laminarini TaxID=3374600 RepID=A0AC61NGQ6_9BACT|nr:Crp/Fnr family transcriptional regulator [Prolixibacteraceae bacterium]